MITIQDLSYRVGDTPLLQHITDTWDTAHCIGIIGPNGSGKTTLLCHIYGDIPSESAIYIDGVDNGNIHRRDRAQLMAVVAQQRGDVEGLLTVEQIVRMGRYPYRDTEKTRHDDQVVAEVLNQLGLYGLRHRPVHSLSGGELQRTFIAKALAQETPYIFLDEPTNHLDIQYKLALLDVLSQYKGTVVMTLHDLILAGRYCDHVVAMVNGKIAYAGTVADVCTSERLSEVFGVPMVVSETEQGFIVTY